MKSLEMITAESVGHTYPQAFLYFGIGSRELPLCSISSISFTLLCAARFIDWFVLCIGDDVSAPQCDVSRRFSRRLVSLGGAMW